MVSQLWAEPQETDPQRDCVAGGMEMRTGQRKEELLGHCGQISASPPPHYHCTHMYSHTNASDAKTRGGAKGSHLGFYLQSSTDML